MLLSQSLAIKEKGLDNLSVNLYLGCEDDIEFFIINTHVPE